MGQGPVGIMIMRLIQYDIITMRLIERELMAMARRIEAYKRKR